MGQRADFSAAAIFVQVVDSGSFRGAARVLELPKSNVSRRVAQLEQQLGARLLQRTTRRLQLTEVGAEYYRHASVAVATLLAAERAAVDVQAEPRGPLRVTVPINFGQLFMPAVVADFLHAYPQVELSLELTDRCVDLVEEGHDVALRAGRLPDSSLIALPLRGTSLVTVASPKYLKTRGVPRTPEELSGHECLPFGLARATKWSFLRARHAPRALTAVKVSGRLAANSFPVLRDAAISGLGIARIPAFIAIVAVQDGKLQVLLDGFESPETPLHVVYPSNLYVSPKVRAFVAFVRAAFTAPPWAPAAT